MVPNYAFNNGIIFFLNTLAFILHDFLFVNNQINSKTYNLEKVVVTNGAHPVLVAAAVVGMHHYYPVHSWLAYTYTHVPSYCLIFGNIDARTSKNL